MSENHTGRMKLFCTIGVGFNLDTCWVVGERAYPAITKKNKIRMPPPKIAPTRTSRLTTMLLESREYVQMEQAIRDGLDRLIGTLTPIKKTPPG